MKKHEAIELARRELCNPGEEVADATDTGMSFVALLKSPEGYVVSGATLDALLGREQLMPGQPFRIAAFDRDAHSDCQAQLQRAGLAPMMLEQVLLGQPDPDVCADCARPEKVTTRRFGPQVVCEECAFDRFLALGETCMHERSLDESSGSSVPCSDCLDKF